VRPVPQIPAPAGETPRSTVIGTAGHIDHGKSALVRALTGIDPDRLAEEQRRGMTIDLGFAHLDLPSGLLLSFVDVPGHGRLIRNMLAGAAGFDLVLLVIAADEGVMPQTREHLDILRFLRVPKGIVVLSKRDLVDQEWLAMVTEDVRAYLTGTFLADAPIVAVSSRTGEGLPELVRTIDRALSAGSRRTAEGPARLPVDRSFVMPGFGTVVTGTIWSGRIAVDDSLVILPAGKSARIRGIQSHGRPVTVARAGQRAALNLGGVSCEDVTRGDVIATLGAFVVATAFDARLHLLPGAPAMKHLDRVRVHIGTAETIGRVALLEESRLEPGRSTYVQVRLEAPTVAARGDPFVIRRFASPLTWGGGEVLQVNPPRHRRKDAGVAESLARLEGGDPRMAVLAALERAGVAGATLDEIARIAAVPREIVAAVSAALAEEGATRAAKDRVFLASIVAREADAIVEALRAYHARVSWRVGMPRAEWSTLARRRAGEGLAALVLNAAAAHVEDHGEFVRVFGHQPSFTPSQATARLRIGARLTGGGTEGLTKEEVAQALGNDAEPVLQWLIDNGTALELRGLIFARAAIEDAATRIVGHLRTVQTLSVAQARDLLGSSRKYILPILEHFDTIGLTRRKGEVRVAGPRAKRGEAVDARQGPERDGT